MSANTIGTEKAARAAIAKARDAGKIIDEVPADLPRPDASWDYDRLQIPPRNPQDRAKFRWNEREQTWEPLRAAPLEGLERAVERRMAMCRLPTQFAAGRTAGDMLHCLNPRGADALRAAYDRVAEAADPDAVLARMLREGLRGERYDVALDRLGARGALGHDLSDAEAVALYLWSGDAKGMKPDGNFPYQVIGRVMRAMGRGEAFPEWPSVAGIITGAWRALDRLPTRTVPVLYRGFKPDGVDAQFWATHLRQGAVVQYNGFTTFTALPEVAAQFAGADGWRIIVRNATQVRDIDAYTVLQGAEHLAPPVRQYRVLFVNEKAREITIEEIPDGERKPLIGPFQFAAPSPDDVIDLGNGRRALRRIAEDPEYMAWIDEQSRLLEQARLNPRPLTEAEEMVISHMQYG